MALFNTPFDITNFLATAASVLKLVDDIITGAGVPGGEGMAKLASFLLVFHAMWRLKKMSESGGRADDGVGGVMGELFIGGLLYKFSDTVAMVDNTLGATGGGAIFIPPGTMSSALTAAMMSSIHIGLISLGTISIFKGFLILHKLSTGQQMQGDPVFSSFWHIFGGALCRAIAGIF